MNWNNYDTKYIIKRLIIGLGMLILFSILTTNKAKALTTTANINYYENQQAHGQSTASYTQTINVYQDGYIPPNVPTHEPFKSLGEGYVIFSLTYRLFNNPTNIILSVDVSNEEQVFTCELGTNMVYYDNTSGNTIMTVKCPVNFTTNHGLKYITIKRNGSTGTVGWYVSKYATFISKDNVNVSLNQQQVVDAITNSQTATIQAMEASGAIAHADAQAAIQATNNAAQQAHADAQAINNTLNNDNVDGANSDLENFKNSSTFSDSTGLQAVIELPLNLVNSFTNTCQPISITIPWLDYTGTIPCMSTIYRQHFNNLYSVVSLIVNAFFIYRILLKIYELVHDAKQPDEDKLEVIDL